MEDKFRLETGQFGTQTLSVHSHAVRVRAQSGLASSHKVSNPCDTRTYPSLSISCLLTASETVWAVAFLDFIVFIFAGFAEFVDAGENCVHQ